MARGDDLLELTPGSQDARADRRGCDAQVAGDLAVRAALECKQLERSAMLAGDLVETGADIGGIEVLPPRATLRGRQRRLVIEWNHRGAPMAPANAIDEQVPHHARHPRARARDREQRATPSRAAFQGVLDQIAGLEARTAQTLREAAQEALVAPEDPIELPSLGSVEGPGTLATRRLHRRSVRGCAREPSPDRMCLERLGQRHLRPDRNPRRTVLRAQLTWQLLSVIHARKERARPRCDAAMQ